MLLVGCTTGGDGGSTPIGAEPTAPTTTSTTLPPVEPYQLVPGEPVPEVKALAVRVLEALGNYDAGSGLPGAAARLAGLAVAPAVPAQAGSLLHPSAASRLEVVYPQLGGFTEEAAAIMVVVRHSLFEGGEETTAVRTVDVRLEHSPSGWSVVSLGSVGGEPPAAPATTPAGAAVLANPNIELPDSARWDIESGRIGDQILLLLDQLGRDRRLAVTVLATGHPREVFGSASVSNHTEGRGVDIWAVDDIPVISDRAEGGVVQSLVTDALAAGATEVGSPWDLDGPGRGASFTNLVHEDHVHVAFD